MTPAASGVNQESPSLARSGAAFELKFLLDDSLAERVEKWAVQGGLRLDSHGDPALGGAYRTTSLYCDTPELDVYQRSPRYKRRKFRVRRYDALPWAFLERKIKAGDRVAKRRSAVPLEELGQLGQPLALTAWPGYWFHRRLLVRRLLPACRIAYERTAYIGACPEGPLRLTLDRRVFGVLESAWSVGPVVQGRPLLKGHVIMEFKFFTALPAPFKRLAADLGLTPSTVSKYRLCREAHGAQYRPAPAGHTELADA